MLHEATAPHASDIEKYDAHDEQSSTDSPHEEPHECLESSQVAGDDGGEQHLDGGGLKQIASSKPSVNSIRAVPDGGLVAWMQVMGSFFLFFNTWGIVNSFGTYQTYYEIGILSSSTPSAISWIGSIQGFLLMLGGTVVGPIYDAGYFHHLIFAGSALIVVGQMMVSLCTQYWQVMLAQGIAIGLGSGCLFVPAVAILSTYFSSHLAVAMGVAAAGSSLGGVIYPIVFYKLQPMIGFPWAQRVIGFIALATFAVSNSVMRVRVLPGGRRKIIDPTAFKDAAFMLFSVGVAVIFCGLYCPFFYLQSYVLGTGIMSERMAFYLLSIMNSTSVFGRIFPNLIADKTGPFNMIIPCALMAGILSLILIGTHSSAGVIIIACFYGFFSGSLVSLPPTIYVHMTKNRGLIGTRMGMGFAIASIGVLTGTPISGAILRASSFTYVWVFGGLMTLAGTAMVTTSRVILAGPNPLTRI